MRRGAHQRGARSDHRRIVDRYRKGIAYFPITPQLFVALADILDRSVTSGIIHLSGEEPLRDTLCFHKQTNGEDWRSS